MTANGIPVLEADQLFCRFGGLIAVKEVSFRLAEGECLAIVGPNGAGKTTLFNLLAGQIKPTAGSVSLYGKPIGALPVHKRARLGIGRTFQIVHTIPTLTVLANAMVGAFHVHARRAKAEERAAAILAQVELGHRADVLAGELTLAERKRLEMARALAGEPSVLLLDEVMAGLNAVEVDRAVQIVRRLNDDGLTVVVIEHDLKVVRALAQRALVLDFGETIAEGSPNEVLQDPRVVEAYIGKQKA